MKNKLFNIKPINIMKKLCLRVLHFIFFMLYVFKKYIKVI